MNLIANINICKRRHWVAGFSKQFKKNKYSKSLVFLRKLFVEVNTAKFLPGNSGHYRCNYHLS
jgi:hypothetical protein